MKLGIAFALSLVACSGAPSSEPGSSGKGAELAARISQSLGVGTSTSPTASTAINTNLQHAPGAPSAPLDVTPPVVATPKLTLTTTPSTVTPVKVPCVANFDVYAEACISVYNQADAQCSNGYIGDSNACAEMYNGCQSEYCSMQYQNCLDQNAECFDPNPSDCEQVEQTAVNLCAADESGCTEDMSMGNYCGTQIQDCIAYANDQKGSCIAAAMAAYSACVNNVGICL